MTRLRVLAWAIAGSSIALSAQVPEPSLGVLPTPPVVGMTDAQQGHENPGGMEQVELYRWATTQGGLTLVCLVLVFFLQRELKRREEDVRADATRREEEMRARESALERDKAILIAVIQQNTVAYTEAAAEIARQSRARERRSNPPHHPS